MGICCMAQETQIGTLYQSKTVGWGRRWEGVSKGRGYMCTDDWFMLRFDRKQQNSVKQLSFNKKINKKILQARLQQYVNWEFPDVQTWFRKGKRTRDQSANIHWITEKAREFQKNIYFCFTDYTRAYDCVDHNTLWEIFKEMGIPDHFTCLMRNLYAGQEAS